MSANAKSLSHDHVHVHDHVHDYVHDDDRGDVLHGHLNYLRNLVSFLKRSITKMH